MFRTKCCVIYDSVPRLQALALNPKPGGPSFANPSGLDQDADTKALHLCSLLPSREKPSQGGTHTGGWGELLEETFGPPDLLSASTSQLPELEESPRAGRGGIVMQEGSRRRSPIMAPLKLRFHASEGGPKATEAVQGGRAPTPPLLVPRAFGRQAGLGGQRLRQVHKGTLSAVQGPPRESRRDSRP